jgi:2-methylcitrate dehydratase PrpD
MVVSERQLTARVAEFVSGTSFDDLPDEAPALVRDALTDCVGVMLAGAREPLAELALSVVGGGQGEVPLVGTSGSSAGPVEAALYHGAIAHALDYDDVSHPSYTHPSCHLLPVLLSLARRVEADGRDIVTAYTVAVEIEGKLGRAMNLGHYNRGWHSTATLGTMGATALGANLIGLDREATAVALAIAGSSASGLRSNFGTMTKPLHAGLAARNGVLAVLLAEAGWTATLDILEHPLGFQQVLAGEGGVDPTAWSKLGEPWELVTEVGLGLKLYPTCAATHCAIEAAQRLRDRIGGAEIVRVTVGQSELGSRILIHPSAPTPLAAKFSMPFCVSAALLTGDTGRHLFSDVGINTTAIRTLMERVTVHIDERVRHHPDFGAAVEIELADGAILEELVTEPKGTQHRWPDRAELKAKFDDCATATLAPAAADRAFEAWQTLPETAALEELASVLSAA